MTMERQEIDLYGLSAEQIGMVRGCGLDVDIYEFPDATTLIAEGRGLAVIDPANIGDGEVEMLSSYWREIDPDDLRVLLASEHPAFSGISFVKAVPGAFGWQEALDVELLAALKETKRDVDFSARIAKALTILRLIENNPGITTRRLSEAVGISERSVKRYIRSLQAACILIEYRDRGWHCLVNPL